MAASEGVSQLCAVLQVAQTCSRPDSLQACLRTRQKRGGDQPRVAPTRPQPAAARPPLQWTAEETFFRSGVFGGQAPDSQWQPTDLGGSHVHRPLGRYTADERDMGGAASSCNKYQPSMRKLIPGYFIVWCACCRRCIMFSMMRDAESPRTPFDLIYTHMERAPQQFQLDNGCNLHSFALAREPSFFAGMRVLIDEPHYRGHSNCSANYNTGESGHILSGHDGICSL